MCVIISTRSCKIVEGENLQANGCNMLEQFQACYPTGCLISELLQIHQGKFIVRVLVQVDGVTRATGMAAADSVEQAEDRARNRALMVLGIEAIAKVQVESPPLQSGSQETPPLTKSLPSTRTDRNQFFITSTELDETYSSLPAESTEGSISNPSSTVPLSETDIFGDLGTVGKDSTESALQFGEVTNTLFHRQQVPAIEQIVREPVDLSDTLIEIEEQIELAKWNTEQVRDYLERVYRKQRRDLTPDELKDFLDYLKLFVKTTVQLKRLGWNSAMGKDYLLQTYNQKARSMLSYEQLLEFLNYLESQPTPHEIA